MIELLHTTLLVSLTLSAACSAQARDLVAGRVLTRNGEPWTGVRVVLAAHPVAHAPELGEIDRVEATTEADGIFRTRILSDRVYVAWVATFGEGRVLRRTGLLRDVQAGDTADLVEADPIEAPTLAVEGQDAWGEDGPLPVELRSATSELGSTALALDAARLAELPAWPDVQLLAVLRGGDGQPRAATWAVPPRRADGGRATHVARFPPPRSISAVVRDEDGAPIAGARLRCLVAEAWTDERPGRSFLRRYLQIWGEGPRSDAAGRAVLRLAADVAEHPPELPRLRSGLVEATAPRRASAFGGRWRTEQFVDNEHVATAPEELTFTLRPAAPIRRRIADGRRPIADHPVLIQRNTLLTWERNSSVLTQRFVVSTDARGVIELPASTQLDGLETVLTLPDAIHTRWASEVGGVLPSRVMLGQDVPPLRMHDLAELRDVRLSAGRMIPGPRRPATVTILPLDDAGRPITNVLEWLAPVDALGRIALRLLPGRFGIYGTFDDGYLVADVIVDAGVEPLAVDYRLRPYAVMPLNVVTPDFPATAGRVEVRFSSYVAGRPDPQAGVLHRMCQRVVAAAQIRDGRLDVRFVPDLAGYSLQFAVVLPDGRQSQQITLEPGSERRTLRIE